MKTSLTFTHFVLEEYYFEIITHPKGTERCLIVRDWVSHTTWLVVKQSGLIVFSDKIIILLRTEQLSRLVDLRKSKDLLTEVKYELKLYVS